LFLGFGRGPGFLVATRARAVSHLEHNETVVKVGHPVSSPDTEKPAGAGFLLESLIDLTFSSSWLRPSLLKPFCRPSFLQPSWQEPSSLLLSVRAPSLPISWLPF
jgi:hypothetical protein